MPLLESELGPDQPAEGEFLLTREEMAELREEREHEPNARNPERELILDAIDEWRSGARATAAAPVGSSLYESRMRHELRTLYQRLLAIEPGNKAAARELAALERGHEPNEYEANALPYRFTIRFPGGAEESGPAGFHGQSLEDTVQQLAAGTPDDTYVRIHDRATKQSYLYRVQNNTPILIRTGTARQVEFPPAAQPNASSYWVWVLSASGEPIEGPYGPHDLEGAKTFARISATEGKHNRAVTRGRDPRAKGFEIIREYKAGTGEHVVKTD